MIPTIFSLILAALASSSAAQHSAQHSSLNAPHNLAQHLAQALPEPTTTPSQAATEIIVGQSREQANKARRTRSTATAHASTAPHSDSAPFLNPLPQLLKGPHYGKIKRARQHRLDQDHDGFVSKHELDLENQTRLAAFREADHNHDGKLDALELRRYQTLLQPKGRGRQR
jgi:EF hand